MSDCYLKKLSANPGKLIPNFEKEQMEYKLILDAQDGKTVFEIVPENHNDYYQIVGETVANTNILNMAEGATKTVEILVCAEHNEDLRIYTVIVDRLSSKLAYLDSITIHPGRLIPFFHRNILHYTCYLPVNVAAVRLFFDAPDSRCLILVNKNEPKATYELLAGRTIFKIKVHSVDESHDINYSVEVMRRQIPRYVLITDPTERVRLEDPISLSPLYCPVRIAEYDIWNTMSLNGFSQLKQQNRFIFGKSVFEPKNFSVQNNVEVEISLADKTCSIPLTYGGFTAEYRLTNITTFLHKCSEPSPFKSYKFNKFTPFLQAFDLFPRFQVDIENSAFEITDKSFKEHYDEMLTEYLFYMPDLPIDNNLSVPNRENPLYWLNNLTILVAKELRKDKENSDLHLTLGCLLEEKYINEDTLNLKGVLRRHNSHSLRVNNERSINNICMNRGFMNPPTLSQQLRSLFDEHIELIEHGCDKQADAVQILYEWKAREACHEGRISIYVEDISHFLGQAFDKYVTALRLDPTHFLNHYHVGRCLVLEGRYGEAIIRIEHALSLNPEHWPSKLLLSLAHTNLVKLSDHKIDRTIELLLECTEFALNKFTLRSMVSEQEARKLKRQLHADDQNFFRLQNPLISRSVLALARLLTKKPSYSIYIRPLHAFHIALHLATMGWCMVSTGSVMAQFEHIIIDCHDELMSMIKEEGSDIPHEYYLRRCEWLNCFISSSILATSQKLIDIQENICRYLVFHQPCNEFYLINLGMVLLKKANMFPARSIKHSEYIKHTILTFKTAVEMNGQAIIGQPVGYLKELPWFKNQKMHYLTKKAPAVINESLKLVENDLPGTQFYPYGYRIRHNQTKSSKKNKNENIKLKQKPEILTDPKISSLKKKKLSMGYTATTMRPSTMANDRKSSLVTIGMEMGTSQEAMIEHVDVEQDDMSNPELLWRQVLMSQGKGFYTRNSHATSSTYKSPGSVDIHAADSAVGGSSVSGYRFYKKKSRINSNSTHPRVTKASRISVANIMRYQSQKISIGDATSLFHLTKHEPESEIQKNQFCRNFSSMGLLINPGTIYSRLMLARAYCANQQYIEAIKSYNFIRKLIQIPSMKTTINREMVDILIKCDNSDEGLEFMSKIRINESKITTEDLMLCYEMIRMLLRMGNIQDPRLFRYSVLMIKHEKRDRLEDLFSLYHFENIWKQICDTYIEQ